jgi:hypothetical protein
VSDWDADFINMAYLRCKWILDGPVLPSLTIQINI